MTIPSRTETEQAVRAALASVTLPPGASAHLAVGYLRSRQLLMVTVRFPPADEWGQFETYRCGYPLQHPYGEGCGHCTRCVVYRPSPATRASVTAVHEAVDAAIADGARAANPVSMFCRLGRYEARL